MSFFQPTSHPNGTYSTHQAVRPPAPHIINLQEDPCYPPPGTCPNPNPPPNQDAYSVRNPDEARDREGTEGSAHHRFSRRPTQMVDNQGFPVSSIMHVSATPTRIPAHPSPGYAAPNSPPEYKPLPSSHDTTLLLAPPPSFHQATCPHSQAVTYVSILPQHSCPHCFDLDGGSEDPESRLSDKVAIGLVILNIVIWGMVFYGYWREWNGEIPAWGGGVSRVGGHGASGWGRICWGEECRWAFVDC
ncbi:hypothetical protein IAR50_006667 [Cryptococcus sp. DSM 104548]